MKNKGFTLIELLLVISIIGVLSSIVISGLNVAKGRAKDAAVKIALSQMANLMMMNMEDYGSYCQLQSGWVTASVSNCDSAFSGNNAPQARSICNDIYKNAAEPWGSGYRLYTGATVAGCATTYTFMVPLNNGKWYCIGSSGRRSESAGYWMSLIDGTDVQGNPSRWSESPAGCYLNP